VNGGWWRRRGGSCGRDPFLKLGEFLLELVNAKSEFVEWKCFERGLNTPRGGEGDESENSSSEK